MTNIRRDCIVSKLRIVENELDGDILYAYQLLEEVIKELKISNSSESDEKLMLSSMHFMTEHINRHIPNSYITINNTVAFAKGVESSYQSFVKFLKHCNIYDQVKHLDEVVIDDSDSEYPATLNADVVDIDKLADMFTRTNILSPNEIRAIMQSDSEEKCTYCNSIRVNSSIQCSNCGANY